MTSPGAALSDTLTHIGSIKKTSHTALSPTCLQRYLPQSLQRSLIPTVSAHVNSAITGHARIFVLHLGGVTSSCTQKPCLHFPALPLPSGFKLLDAENKAGDVQRQRKGEETGQGHTFVLVLPANDKERLSPPRWSTEILTRGITNSNLSALCFVVPLSSLQSQQLRQESVSRCLWSGRLRDSWRARKSALTSMTRGGNCYKRDVTCLSRQFALQQISMHKNTPEHAPATPDVLRPLSPPLFHQVSFR